MPVSSGARTGGDHYQHLYAWFLLLDLLKPISQIQSITVEDSTAGSVDDVTIRYKPEAEKADEFYQVKFHVDHRRAYSTEFLLEQPQGGKSLLKKFWDTWNLLRMQDPSRSVDLYLVSNWDWDTNDPLKKVLSGYGGQLDNKFLSSSNRTEVGKERKKWEDHLGVENTGDFENFIRHLHFYINYRSRDQLEKDISRRMGDLNLKSDINTIDAINTKIAKWVQQGIINITASELNKFIDENKFKVKNEQSITVAFISRNDQYFGIEADYSKNWCEYFQDLSNRRGDIIDPSDWNGNLTNELRELKYEINKERYKLIQARFKTHLSIGIAFGLYFSENAGYVLEVEQQGLFWRTDAPKNPAFKMLISSEGNEHGESLAGDPNTIAVGISITPSLELEVRRYFDNHPELASALLFLQPERPLGNDCFQTAGDVTAFADQVKMIISSFVKQRDATKLTIFYSGPISGAIFLGHRFNNICHLQLMEYERPTYAPSFLLLN